MASTPNWPLIQNGSTGTNVRALQASSIIMDSIYPLTVFLETALLRQLQAFREIIVSL